MAQVARRNNMFAIVVTIAVVVVIGVITAVVIWMNSLAAGPTTTPQGAIIDTETGAISIGSGERTVATHVDFMCPACRSFEEAYGPTIEDQIDAGTITLDVHPVSILDNRSTTEYSSRAGGAMYAVAAVDPDNAYAFMQAMYANQPAEGGEGLSDEQIIEVARGAGVNVTEELEQAILSRGYQNFVKGQELPDGARGTPAVAVDGELIALTGDPQADIVARLQ